MTSSADTTSSGLVVIFASANVNASDGYALILTNAIPQVTEVRFYEETVDHAAQHSEFPAEFPSVVQAVGDALISPISVEKSYGNSYVFVGQSLNASGYRLRVPIKVFGDTTSAMVKTYFFGEGDTDPEIVFTAGESE